MKRASIAASAILFAATCIFAQQQDAAVQQVPNAPQDSVSEIDKTTAEQSSNNARTAGLGIRAGSVTAGLGIRADYNFADYWGTEEMNGANDEASGWGFNVGITVRFEFLDVLWFTPELHYEYFKLTQDYDEIEVQFKQSNLVLPLMLRAVLHPRAYFEVGPQLSLNLSNDFEYDAERGDIHIPGADDIKVDKPHDFDDNVEQATIAFGVAMGLGFYIIPDRLSVNARIYVGLTDLYPDATSIMLYEGEDNIVNGKVVPEKSKVMVGTKLRTIKLGASFWFI
ncbi:MAG: PorT family protein [Fibrobacter sp.]|nr:PorT family protein [Fibrobacter sp.]